MLVTKDATDGTQTSSDKRDCIVHTQSMSVYRSSGPRPIESRCHGYLPVSYTHLDVYKRQEVRYPRMFFISRKIDYSCTIFI